MEPLGATSETRGGFNTVKFCTGRLKPQHSEASVGARFGAAWSFAVAEKHGLIGAQGLYFAVGIRYLGP